MYDGARLPSILNRVGTASSIDVLCERLAGGARQMGFEYVAQTQHGGLPRLVQPALIVTNYPPDFAGSYIDNHQYVFGPVYHVSEQMDRPFTWKEITNYADLDEKQIALFVAVRGHGIVDAVTVPLNIPGEASASCPFARPNPVKATPDLMTALHVIAIFAFNVALRLHKPDRRFVHHRAQLRPLRLAHQ